MLWSPVVKGNGGSQYNQLGHIGAIDQNIKTSFGVSIEFVVNERFRECMQEMRTFAKSKTADCWRAFKITQPCALNFTQAL